ncbi:AAA family ATPase, partial [Xanthomonas sacchari]|uniref:AAA family ATPase n=2 Tax=Xanthomonas TaxID=338 RepID=UPI00225924D0
MSVPQLPLALRYPPEQRLDRYLAAPDGLLAQLQAVADGAADDWVYLSGPAGTGKTHLALALCAATEQAGRSAAYLPLQAAAGRLRDALEALEGRDLVALDGLEAIAGQREDEVALFDFHNRARSAGVTLLYTAQAMPDGLALSLPDLRSRLS